eukprot:TRINITY_DN76388_c0_g1_i1.p1 TRINITY_DN76388_c0_g1~~TRINITY_DN76388_c0_g1_i1.p1  ORF type:complete len:120 (+),score=8.80 TRINITY_DN76388_c0_g1_i1:25-360(+)
MHPRRRSPTVRAGEGTGGGVPPPKIGPLLEPEVTAPISGHTHRRPVSAGHSASSMMKTSPVNTTKLIKAMNQSYQETVDASDGNPTFTSSLNLTMRSDYGVTIDKKVGPSV